MGSPGSVELSVVLPFADHEDVVGAACRQLAGQLRGLGLGFEILAVDEGSGDNSHALLGLLRAELPELRVVAGTSPRGFSVGAAEARGRVLVMLEPAAALGSLAPLGRAIERVVGGIDVLLLPGRFVVARRTRILGVLEPLRARGDDFERRLARRADKRGLTVETWAPRPAPARPLGRLIAALTGAR